MLVQAAEAGVINYQQFAEQTENNISHSAGKKSGAYHARTVTWWISRICQKFPPVCRRSLLRRRPDVRQAEENLVAANANVGVAKALSSRNSRSPAASARRASSLAASCGTGDVLGRGGGT